MSRLEELVDELRSLEQWLRQLDEWIRDEKNKERIAGFERQKGYVRGEIVRVKRAIVDERAGRGDKEKKKERR